VISIATGLDHAEDASAHRDLVRLGFVAAPRGVVGDAADRGIAGMNAIAFIRNFPAPLAKSRGKTVLVAGTARPLILAASSLISDFPKNISVPT